MRQWICRAWGLVWETIAYPLRVFRPRRHRVNIHRHGEFTDRPPPLHWVPCHPATIHRFKATMACPAGHVLTLRIHSIKSDGSLAPSVVCPVERCTFHEYVRLADWTFGSIR